MKGPFEDILLEAVLLRERSLTSLAPKAAGYAYIGQRLHPVHSQASSCGPVRGVHVRRAPCAWPAAVGLWDGPAQTITIVRACGMPGSQCWVITTNCYGTTPAK